VRRPEPDRPADRRLKHSNEDPTHHKGSNMIAHPATATSATGTSAARPSATWTSERVEQLKGCINAGLSCSQIAAEIGVTRNAVIGKLNRLGLSRPRTCSARATAKARRLAPQKRHANSHAASDSHEASPRASGRETFIPSGHGCSLLELSPGKCRWPISEQRAEEFLFCGNNQVEGLSYCVGHARMAYKSVARVRSTARP